MIQLKAVILLIFIGYSLNGLACGKTLFPRPAAIEQDVQFWQRVYTEISTSEGFVHDDEQLNIVYEKINIPKKYGRKEHRQLVNNAKQKYEKILQTLSQGKRKGLSKEAKRVLKLWPKNTTDNDFKQAQERIRFQLGQSDQFSAGLARSGAWKPYILSTLKELGLPPEIAVLPHVESSFNQKAFSKIGAAGMWQFTRLTGIQFMQIDDVLDERMDPFPATIAAAKLLLRNHKITGSWPLALTAYNHGAGGMKKAVKQLGTCDIVKVIREYKGRRFGFASRNFYVSFLAALEIDSNPKKYFKKIDYAAPVDYATVVIPAYMQADTVLKALKLEQQRADIVSINPALSAAVWAGRKYIPKDYTFRFKPAPALTVALATQALAKIPAEVKFAGQNTQQRYHKIKRGQTLSGIAAHYKVRLRELIAANQLKNQHRIRIGQVLKVPVDVGKSRLVAKKAVKKRATKIASITKPKVTRSSKVSRAPKIARSKKLARHKPVASGRYRVKPGDTLDGIANRHHVRAKDLLARNNIKNKNKIYPGQILRITQEKTDHYVVRRGDSLDRIAKRLGKDVKILLALNNIRDKNRIFPGQKLVIVK